MVFIDFVYAAPMLTPPVSSGKKGALIKEHRRDFFDKSKRYSNKNAISNFSYNKKSLFPPPFYYGIELPYFDSSLSFDEELWNAIKMTIFPWEERKTESQGFIPDIKIAKDSTIRIAGRKSVSFTFSSTKYPKRVPTPTMPVSQTDFKIDQTLQVNVEGNIKNHVFINVDYDDTKDSSEKQKISVVYKGDEDNIIQEIALGNIVLSIPNSELISFRRELFGARGTLKFGPFSYYALATKEEGETKNSAFTGNAEATKFSIYDDNFEKNFFSLKKGKPSTLLPLKAGSVKVYYDDNIYNEKDDSSALVYDDGTKRYYFHYLLPFNDYVIDYQKGIIEFKRSISTGFVAVVYEDANGNKYGIDSESSFAPIIISSVDDDSITYQYRINGKYFLKSDSINAATFLLKILTFDDTDSISIAGKVYSYNYLFGLDKDNDGVVDADVVDFEKGILTFPEDEPFNFKKYLAGDGSVNYMLLPDYLRKVYNDIGDAQFKLLIDKLDNSNIYAFLSNPNNKYKIYVEYLSPTPVFSLNQTNIIENSERVVVDGKEAVRGKDYSIDYFSGTVQFLNNELITPNSKIEITFEYRPFIAMKSRTLFGNRIEYDDGGALTFGATYLADWMPKDNKITTPTFGDETTKHAIYGVNFRYKKDFGKIKTDIKAEIAQSDINPNTYGESYIDNMENSTLLKDISLSLTSWFLASSPLTVDPDTRFVKNSKGEVVLDNNVFFENHNIYKDEISSKYEHDLIRTLKIKELPNDSSQFFSYAQNFSRTGVDLTSYKQIEIWYKASPGAVGTIYLDLGRISEDSDNDNILDTEDKNFDTILDENEDVGYKFNFGGNTYMIGAKNNIIDSEDLNRNGSLDTIENCLTYSFSLSDGEPSGNSGWRIIKLDLKNDVNGVITPDVITNILSKVNQIRLRGIGFNGGELSFAKISILGTVWKVDTIYPEIGNRFSISTISNLNASSSDYTPLHNETVSGGDAKKEDSSLVLDFDMHGFDGDDNFAYCKKDYVTGYNLSDYKKLRFAYFVKETIGVYELFFRIATSDNSYYEIRKVVSPDMANGKWHFLDVDLASLENNPDVFIAGTPTIQNIHSIYTGVRSRRGATNPTNINDGYKGRIYINDILLKDITQARGVAKIAHFMTTYKNVLSVSANYSKKDGDYALLGQTPGNTDSLSSSFSTSVYFGKLFPFLNLNMPVRFNVYNAKTDSHGTLDNAGSYFSQGKNESNRYNFSFTLSKDKFPTLTYSYGYNSTENTLSSSPYNSEAIMHSATFSYSFPKLKVLSFYVLPARLMFSTSENLNRTFYEDELHKDISTKNNNYALNLNWTPFKNLTDSFSYSLAEMWDKFCSSYANKNEQYRFNNSYSGTVKRRVDFFLNYNTQFSTSWNRDLALSKGGYALANYNASRDYSARITFHFLDYLKWAKIFSNSADLTTEYSNRYTLYYDSVDTSYDWRVVLGDFSDFYDSELLRDKNFQNRYTLSYRTNLFSLLDSSLKYAYSDNKRYYSGTTSKTISKTWPSFTFTLSDFYKIDFLKWMKKVILNQSLNISYEKNTNTTYSTIKTLSETISPSLSWNMTFKNDITGNFVLRYNKKKSVTGDNLPQYIYNKSASASFNFNLRAKRFVKMFLKKKKQAINTYLNVGINFLYNGTEYENMSGQENESYDIKTSASYTFSNNFKLTGNLGYKIYDSSVVAYSYRTVTIGFSLEAEF